MNVRGYQNGRNAKIVLHTRRATFRERKPLVQLPKFIIGAEQIARMG